MSNPREIAVLTLHKTIHPNASKINISDSEQGVSFVKMLNQTSLRDDDHFWDVKMFETKEVCLPINKTQ